MEIKIKTNRALLLANGWEPTLDTTYRKWVGNFRLKVHYDHDGCDHNGYIWRLDVDGIKFYANDPESKYVHLKDMPVILDELKKLEIKY